ncbi:hypothetical protein SSP24_57040 [Streptomyces spinoverrucosus]|uniref:Immunity protein Imm1 n=1 Tax=Streptomyces spinoverrucosus TaxID=284043 RepID=A0A4Y3VQT8_9ACTN|nr:Imm1 family immunity protein [Streptomyces spinoverrucosus]GEC08049.1 hypothetical protein SSP24_57040 [Streptomyces spinoverrucosus]GHB65123.1 hypothetical protein GCM10010397_38890 [Streptomyces spinoverrucosus]
MVGNVERLMQDELWPVTVRAEARYKLGHGADPAKLVTPEDVDRVIDELLTGGPKYQTLAQIHSMERERTWAGAFDHELVVGANAELNAGIMTYMDEFGNFATVGDPGSRKEPLYHLMGHMRELPDECEISLDLVRQAAKEFVFAGGVRPTCVAWKPIEW